MLPFKEELIDNIYYRTFKENINDDLLVWHRDREDRIIESLDTTDWKIQIDNELPKVIIDRIFIPMGVYHRLIKGTNDLRLKVVKMI